LTRIFRTMPDRLLSGRDAGTGAQILSIHDPKIFGLVERCLPPHGAIRWCP
jgi:hypothetical protein